MTAQNESLIKLSIKDFFTKDILKLALLPFIITMVVMYTLFFIAADYGLDQLANTQVQIQQSQTSMNPDGTTHTETLNEFFSGSSVMTFLLKYSVTSWIVTFLIYTVGGFLVMYISVIIALFVMGFLTPWVVKIIQSRHYQHIPIEGFGGISEIIWHFSKTFLITFFLFLVLVPFYFIPMLNIVAINIPTYYLFHRLLNFDVGSTICSKTHYLQIMSQRGNAIRFKTLVMYLLTLLPFVALFSIIYFVVYLAHVYFYELTMLYNNTRVENTATPKALDH
jgi:hypothetical protein